jgi:hypothetical protein
MASDTLMFTVRVWAARHFLERLPRDCPNRRDTNLQTSKLERMVEKFQKRFWPAQMEEMLGGAVSKARKKEMGEELAKLNEQAKKLKASLSKTIEEGFYIRNPESSITPREFRRMFAVSERDFEKVIAEATRLHRKALFFGEAERAAKLKS